MNMIQQRDCDPGEVFCSEHGFQAAVNASTGERIMVRFKTRTGVYETRSGTPEWAALCAQMSQRMSDVEGRSVGPGTCEACREREVVEGGSRAECSYCGVQSVDGKFAGCTL